jgi:hypothetical protein
MSLISSWRVNFTGDLHPPIGMERHPLYFSQGKQVQ